MCGSLKQQLAKTRLDGALSSFGLVVDDSAHGSGWNKIFNISSNPNHSMIP